MTDSTSQALVASLRSHRFFSTWDLPMFERLIAQSELATYNVGQPLWCEGDVAKETFFLIEGRLERSRMVRPDGLRTEQVSEPGTPISIESLVKGWQHTSTCKPLERTKVLGFRREAFRQMFEQGDPVAYDLVDAISEDLVKQMRDTNERLHKVFGQPAETLRILRRRMREEQD